MGLIVQKYGGTSVGAPEKIKQVARRIQRVKSEGHSLIVVVSAMGHTTDELLKLSREISLTPPQRELDMLLTAGERISMSLLAMALHEVHVPAISLTGSQSGIITTTRHGRAEIQSIRPIRIEEGLKSGKVVLVAGFQGVSAEKEVTTLGRGGSDTTAVALAAHFNADRCEILKDVQGIFSADPRSLHTARLWPVCPLKDLYRMSILGNSVLHHRACELAVQKNMTILVGHSEQDEFGTRVIPESKTPSVTAIISKPSVNILKITDPPSAFLVDLKKFFQEEGAVIPFERVEQERAVFISYDVASDRLQQFLRERMLNSNLYSIQEGDLISAYGTLMNHPWQKDLAKHAIQAQEFFQSDCEVAAIVPSVQALKTQDLFHQIAVV